MAANRMDPTSGPDAASADAPASASAPATAAAGGFKAWLPLLITLLAMPALAYAMTTFVLVPRLQRGLGITPPEATESSSPSKEAASGKRESVAMNKLLVNVAGTMGARYLLVSLSVVGVGSDFSGTMRAAEPQMRDMAMGALSSKTLVDLEKPGARNLIRSELISGFNNILGGAVVQEIYLTEFAIQ